LHSLPLLFQLLLNAKRRVFHLIDHLCGIHLL
jgi:hypothetical protein